MKTLTINPTFRDLIPALSAEELIQLENNLNADGCRDPLVVWGDVIVDGHNRYEICTRNLIPFKTVSKDFSDEEAVIDWIERNQLGRRNLTADARKLILGRRYNRQKKATTDGGKGTPKATEDQIDPRLSTAEKLAAENHVSPATVKRAGKFAEEADKNPEMAKAILSGEKVKLPHAPSKPAPEPAEDCGAEETEPESDGVDTEDPVDESTMTLKTINPRTADGGTKTITCGRALAIYLKCMECLGWEGNPKRDCCSPNCPLYPWRGRTYKTIRGDKKAKK